MRIPSVEGIAVLLAAVWTATPATAQVTIAPPSIMPAEWERFALRVVNQSDTPTVAIRLTVPQAIAVLGVESPPGWTFAVDRGSDTTPQYIEWSAGSLARGEFREFAFLGRLAGDARRRNLIFPVQLTRAGGTRVEWSRGSEASGDPLIVTIAGTTVVSVWGAVALAGVAVGIAILALGLAVSRKPAMQSHPPRS